MRRLHLIVGVMALLGPCGWAGPRTATPFLRPPPKSKRSCVLYIFRERAAAGAAVTFQLLLDDEPLGTLNTGEYMRIEVVPGSYRLMVRPSGRVAVMASSQFVAKGGEEVLLRIKGGRISFLSPTQENFKAVETYSRYPAFKGAQERLLKRLADASASKRTPTRTSKAEPARAPPVEMLHPDVVALFGVRLVNNESAKPLLEGLWELMSALLTRSKRFSLVPKVDIQQAIEDQKRTSYKDCYDSACQIEVGKALAAQKTIATTISQFGALCQVSITMYDLRSTATEAAGMKRGNCTPEGLLESTEGALNALIETVAGEVSLTP